MGSLQLHAAVGTSVGASATARAEKPCDERWLVERARLGHGEAFAELYKRHQARAYRTALRILRNQHDAEDAVQKAFHCALMNFRRFRADSTFSTWLTRIAINEALMLLRQRRTREFCSESGIHSGQFDGVTDIADAGPSPEELFSENERRATLLRAITKLRKNLRVVVLHRELKGLTNAETAKVLGLTVSAVKARCFHARRFLRKHLERKFVDTGLLNLQKTKA